MSEYFRNPHDTIGEYTRSEIDRDCLPLSRDMINRNKEPLLAVAVRKLQQNGKISILDAGCGTGHALFDIYDQLSFRTGVGQQNIKAVGVNLADYSNESRDSYARRAIKDKKLTYIVSDIEDVDLKPESFDLIYSYEVLIHTPNTKAARIINHLLGFLKPDGTLYVGLTPEQFDSSFIQASLRNLENAGGDVFHYAKQQNEQGRVFLALQKTIPENI